MNLITDAQVQQFETEGYFVTEPVFAPATIADMNSEFQRLHTEEVEKAVARGATEKELVLFRDRLFLPQAHTRSDIIARFVKEPFYQEVCARLIGPDADLYYNQLVIKSPEKGRHFGWHQDSGYTPTKPLAYVTCWTAISESFLENGCIWVIPGSHKRGLIEHRLNEEETSVDAVVEDESGAIPVEMKPGQVAVFSSLTLHKSGPNTSKVPRYGFVPQYHVANPILCKTGEPGGDLYPILRGGVPV